MNNESKRLIIECKNEDEFEKMVGIFSRCLYIDKKNIDAYRLNNDKYAYIFGYVEKNTQFCNKKKLTKEQEKEIYYKKTSGQKVKLLSQEYGVGKSTIYEIVKKYDNPYENHNEKNLVINYHSIIDNKNDEKDMLKQLEELEKEYANNTSKM